MATERKKSNADDGAGALKAPRRQRIGYREFVDLPDWGIKGVKAKADSGARVSAIDVADLVELDGDRVRFDVVLSRARRHKRVTVEANVVRRAQVRSSLGDIHSRWTVETTIRVGPVEKTVEVGLVCRRNMICRMLLGRQALAGDFLVDAGRVYLYGKRSKKKKMTTTSKNPRRRRDPHGH